MKSASNERLPVARYGVAIRIEEDIIELLRDEQYRLRKKEGKKLSYSEILRRMWAAYTAPGVSDKPAAARRKSS